MCKAALETLTELSEEGHMSCNDSGDDVDESVHTKMDTEVTVIIAENEPNETSKIHSSETCRQSLWKHPTGESQLCSFVC